MTKICRPTNQSAAPATMTANAMIAAHAPRSSSGAGRFCNRTRAPRSKLVVNQQRRHADWNIEPIGPGALQHLAAPGGRAATGYRAVMNGNPGQVTRPHNGHPQQSPHPAHPCRRHGSRGIAELVEPCGFRLLNPARETCPGQFSSAWEALFACDSITDWTPKAGLEAALDSRLLLAIAEAAERHPGRVNRRRGLRGHRAGGISYAGSAWNLSR